MERASTIACHLSIYPENDAPATRIADRTSPVAFVAFSTRLLQNRRQLIYRGISGCVRVFHWRMEKKKKKKEESGESKSEEK